MNSVLSNFHTHTSYCDGTNNPRELIEAALKKDFIALGFSGHGEDAQKYGMDSDALAIYKLEIEALKKEFADVIDIFIGLEVDSTSKEIPLWLDYTIGSVHMLQYGGEYYFVDNTEELLRECINECFNSNPYLMAQSYFTELVRHANAIHPDIIGHFDLITKYNADGRLFDTSHPKYIDAAFEAIEALVDLGCIIEVNTGGMARGYMKAPFPDSRLLARVRELNGKVMINSDAHSTDKLNYAFDRAAQLLLAVGFDERYELSKQGFVPVKL